MEGKSKNFQFFFLAEYFVERYGFRPQFSPSAPLYPSQNNLYPSLNPQSYPTQNPTNPNNQGRTIDTSFVTNLKLQKFLNLQLFVGSMVQLLSAQCHQQHSKGVWTVMVTPFMLVEPTMMVI